ncbi:C10 family peptidase [Enterobacter sp. WCHEn045836]|uniref:C10 family peptidase n=1 Tax=Enterobacter sp. WCHEn045836 TaxID=2497434 RepID=UPI0016395CD3|nr:C10 family peptidase [Enterobacter sp. WCHEn045836]
MTHIDAISRFATDYVKGKLSSEDVVFLERKGNVVIFDVVPSGFLIVVDDNSSFRVIGYSQCGSFKSNPVIESIISAANNHAVSLNNRCETNHKFEPISPLIETKWNQYGQSLPKRGMVSGCVPAGLAQIAYYYRHPLHGLKATTEYSYNDSEGNVINIPEINLPEITYEWDKMPQVVDENTTEESLKRVADLMYHIGASMNIKFDYFETATDANIYYKKMHEYFGYDIEDLLFTFSKTGNETVTKEELLALINNSLRKKRPVTVGGAKSGTKTTHYFIACGIDIDGFVYFNFGWGGNGDGYFDIFDIAYSIDMIAGFNVKPREPDYLSLVEHSQFSEDIIYGEPVEVNANFKNTSSCDFLGELGLGVNLNPANYVVTRDWSAVFDVFAVVSTEKISSQGEVFIRFNESIPDGYGFGELFLYFMAKNTKDNTEWRYVDRQPLRLTHRRKVSVSGIFICSQIGIEDNLHPGWEGEAEIHISNQSDGNVSGGVILCFIDGYGNILHKVSERHYISMGSNEVKKIVIDVSLSKEFEVGNYHLAAIYDNAGSLSELSWEILPFDDTNAENTRLVKVRNIIRSSCNARLMKSLDVPSSGIRGESSFRTTLVVKNIGEELIFNPDGVLTLILLDELNRRYPFTHSHSQVGMGPGQQYSLELDIALPTNMDIGPYVLSLQVNDTLTSRESYEIDIFSPGDDSIVNQVVFTVLPDTAARFVKLTKNLVAPEEISQGTEFELPVQCRMDGDAYFYGDLRVVIENPGGDTIELGRIEVLFTREGDEQIFIINCKLNEKAEPGPYSLYVIGNSWGDEANKAILTGVSEEIVDKIKLAVK